MCNYAQKYCQGREEGLAKIKRKSAHACEQRPTEENGSTKMHLIVCRYNSIVVLTLI